MSRLVKGMFIVGTIFCLDVTLVNYTNNKIQVDYQDNQENRKVIQENRELSKMKFTASPYLPFRFMQIIYGNRLREIPHVDFEREIIKGPIGEDMALGLLKRLGKTTFVL